MEKLTADEIEEIAFVFGNGVDQIPWAESESHGEPDNPAPSYHVYVSDGQLMLIAPGNEDNPDCASDLADSSTKVCRAIRQLQAEIKVMRDNIYQMPDNCKFAKAGTCPFVQGQV